MNRLLTCISAVAVLGAVASAQVSSSYSFSQSVGTYVPITGGTLLAAANAPSGVGGLDDNNYPMTLPFTFAFDGVGYSQITAQTNGWLSFGATAPATQYGPLNSTDVVPGIVSAFGRDLMGGFMFAGDRAIGSNLINNVSSVGPLQVGDFIAGTGIPTGATITAISGTTITISANATTAATGTYLYAAGPWAEMRYETLGSAPNRTFVVQWSNFRRYTVSALATAQHMSLNFQIRLNESSNLVEVVYGNCSPGLTTLTTVNQVGLRGPNNTFPANVNNRLNVKGTSDWATSTAGTANSSGEVFNNVAPANVIPSGLTYTWTPALIATNINYGAGCGQAPGSFYEYIPVTAAIDLSNTAIAMTLTPAGYVVTPSANTFVAPSGSATNLLLGDDAGVTVTPSTSFPYPGGSTPSFFVCSNGFVSTATNGTSFQPSPAAFLGWTNPAWAVWRDFLTATSATPGGGDIWTEEAGGYYYITWLGVFGYQGTAAGVTPSTFQFQFELATGNVHIVFLSMDTVSVSGYTGGEGWVIGYSSAGASIDPLSQDLSVTVPLTFIAKGVDTPAMALNAAPTPVLGNTVVYTTSNIPLTAAISVHLISIGTGIAPLAIPGAPGCSQLVDLNASVSSLLIGAPSATFSLTIPTHSSFIGLPLANQAASLVPGINPLQVITSNGVKSTISNL